MATPSFRSIYYPSDPFVDKFTHGQIWDKRYTRRDGLATKGTGGRDHVVGLLVNTFYVDSTDLLGLQSIASRKVHMPCGHMVRKRADLSFGHSISSLALT
jgi:hypothetical protein